MIRFLTFLHIRFHLNFFVTLCVIFLAKLTQLSAFTKTTDWEDQSLICCLEQCQNFYILRFLLFCGILQINFNFTQYHTVNKSCLVDIWLTITYWHPAYDMHSSYICKFPTEITDLFTLKKKKKTLAIIDFHALFIFYKLTQIFRPQQHITCNNFIVFRGSPLYNEQRQHL